MPAPQATRVTCTHRQPSQLHTVHIHFLLISPRWSAVQNLAGHTIREHFAFAFRGDDVAHWRIWKYLTEMAHHTTAPTSLPPHFHHPLYEYDVYYFVTEDFIKVRFWTRRRRSSTRIFTDVLGNTLVCSGCIGVLAWTSTIVPCSDVYDFYGGFPKDAFLDSSPTIVHTHLSEDMAGPGR